MKYKTDELIGRELDAAVALALGMKTRIYDANTGAPIFKTYQTKLDTGPVESNCGDDFEPSRLWHHGGPIIEREHIETVPVAAPDVEGLLWMARKHDAQGVFLPGHTDSSLLVAAMRCFVFVAFGPEVDLQRSADA